MGNFYEHFFLIKSIIQKLRSMLLKRFKTASEKKMLYIYIYVNITYPGNFAKIWDTFYI